MNGATSAPLHPASLRSGVIDSCRALACLSVVLFHGCDTLDHSTHPFLSTFAAVGCHGWLGVSVFFVVSGYCLAQAVEDRARQARTALDFWADRLLRIFPVYWAALLFAIVLALAATPLNRLPAASAYPASPPGWLANLTLTTAWLGELPRLTVSWSLDFEVGFYVLMGGVLLFRADRPSHRLILYAALTTLAHLPGIPEWAPVLRAWPQFACGLAVHGALRSSLPGAVRLLAGLYPAGLAATYFAIGDSLAAFTPLFALALLAMLALEPRLPAPPRPLVVLGIASYSIYLVHMPVMSPALNLARRVLPETSFVFALVWLGHIALGVTAGILFYRWVERRCEAFRRWAVVGSRRPTLFRGAGMLPVRDCPTAQ